jgi:membrane-associated phospholipid phosphatase
MEHWQAATAAFFGYAAVVAVLPRGLSPQRRRTAFAGVAGGVLVLAGSCGLSADGFANVWLLPPAALLIGYWTSGLLFVAPMPRAERALARIDEILAIDAIAARTPRLAAEVLELAYVCVYPLIPLALALALRGGVTADRFWTVILLTDYVCFGMLPWIQTRPPRAVGCGRPWRSSWRAVNLRVVDASSVQVNTFPSGHAAEAVAAALLVSGSPAPVIALMWLAAAAISAGAVFGRYHYAADAITGWAVALAVYLIAFS